MRKDALTREDFENAQVIYMPGLSTACPENPDQPREREDYLTKVLEPLIQSGKVGDGKKSKWDDRKFRFDGIGEVGVYDKRKGMWAPIADVIALKLGVTYYQECAECRKWDYYKKEKMTQKGEEIFNDPYAFFTRGCGVEVTPITSEGHIFVGKRQSGDSTYEGELAAVNGWVDYEERLFNVDFRKDSLREIKEEFGIKKDDVIDFREDAFRSVQKEFGIKRKDITGLIFCGLYPSPSQADMDLLYLAPLRIGDKEFLDRFEKRQDKEHGKLVKIVGYQDMRELLQTGSLPGVKGKFDLLYSLRASLEQIKPEELA